ncbi:hypothetical protein Calag_0366 [Caldisphaera lagunensis DSM 15908]|uniref:DUF4064 domain-containing protein n=1 Tax=Caldisphaera lagunensis (strain DSM 15908 / JCM 11604 / ANMR 0165 / IC-154) TaxID=1056495 RepID=L0AAL7_CALLD|nr:hypothetical protein [Caldisphaera lagunensis]AFZ70142.1 hypothetical protein Calag_0366 [Caldisphaera lagunensis DSM 15908]
MQNVNEKVPGKGLVIASIALAILFSLIVLYAGYSLSTLPASIFSNITKTYGQLSSLNLTGTDIIRLAANVLYGYGIIFLILGLVSIPFVYLPLYHNLPEKAIGPALAIGIIEIIVGIFSILFVIPGILMVIAWYQVRKFNYEMKIKASLSH